jgi:hypothetical protein
VFKILGAKNRRKNLQKYPGPTFQIRPGPGYFSRAQKADLNQPCTHQIDMKNIGECYKDFFGYFNALETYGEYEL